MNFSKSALLFFSIMVVVFTMASCSVFKPKYGCPSSGKNVGAERVLSGEKLPKAKKFKA